MAIETIRKVTMHFRSRFVTLNKHHAYFLLVDNGTVGKYGAEIALKRKLEKFISTQRLSANFSTPLVWDGRTRHSSIEDGGWSNCM